jgi:hypothetical protein
MIADYHAYMVYQYESLAYALLYIIYIYIYDDSYTDETDCCGFLR